MCALAPPPPPPGAGCATAAGTAPRSPAIPSARLPRRRRQRGAPVGPAAAPRRPSSGQVAPRLPRAARRRPASRRGPPPPCPAPEKLGPRGPAHASLCPEASLRPAAPERGDRFWFLFRTAERCPQLRGVPRAAARVRPRLSERHREPKPAAQRGSGTGGRQAAAGGGGAGLRCSDRTARRFGSWDVLLAADAAVGKQVAARGRETDSVAVLFHRVISSLHIIISLPLKKKKIVRSQGTSGVPYSNPLLKQVLHSRLCRKAPRCGFVLSLEKETRQALQAGVHWLCHSHRREVFPHIVWNLL